MKIRSITSFYDPGAASAEYDLNNLAETSMAIRSAVNDHYLPVQSTRLATSPFPSYLSGQTPMDLVHFAITLERKSLELGWQYLAMGPALPDCSWSYRVIPEMIRATENSFFSAVIADRVKLYPAAALESARIIHQSAAISVDGFANLRFAALANLGPWTPFLPAAYHQSGELPAVSIAVECADAVVEAFSTQQDLEACRQKLLSTLEQTARNLEALVQPWLQKHNFLLKGFDFSPAPFPEDWCSLAGAAELLGLSHIGGIGSLTPVAFIADTLDRGSWLKTGFNGMMLPLLEDSILAKRAAEGQLTVKDLMLYATMCGTGLDTIPLPGETTVEQLQAVLMDIGAMSLRLGKPLTARLMPIPGKVVGDLTDFKFAFFANSRVLALDGQNLSGLLTRETPINIQPRQGKKPIF